MTVGETGAKAGKQDARAKQVDYESRPGQKGEAEGESAEKTQAKTVNVRYMVDDVEAAVAFYTTHFGFTLISNAAPAFADVRRGDLRLLISGPKSSAGRAMPDGRRPEPGGWNRFELVVEDLVAEVERLRAAGLKFRNDIVTGPGGSQILVEDPSGNPIELFQPAS
jgi:catechol 2,3-dioxygenase-like lactoylglutathione lyase family enzyme